MMNEVGPGINGGAQDPGVGEGDPARGESRRSILLAAGGTGGHIYPAVALAEALREQAPEVEIRFCCGSRPYEWQIYRRLGIEPWRLPVTFHRRGWLQRARLLRQMTSSLWRVWRGLRKQPVQVAVGFGGYPSVAPMLAAYLSGARLVIHEQNARPGAANRLLSGLAQRIATGLPTADGILPPTRTRHLGNPIREAVRRRVDPQEARDFFGLRPERPICLCLGGSQGAVGINRLLLALLRQYQEPDPQGVGWQLLWSTGPAHYGDVIQGLGELGIDPTQHCINPYIDEMAIAYSAADLVLARSGALTLAEITAVGLPAVLVPLPTSTGGHQAINARRLVHAGAAEIIEEADPRAAQSLAGLLEGWARDPAGLARMGAAARSEGRPEAADELARWVLDLIPNPSHS